MGSQAGGNPRSVIASVPVSISHGDSYYQAAARAPTILFSSTRFVLFQHICFNLPPQNVALGSLSAAVAAIQAYAKIIRCGAMDGAHRTGEA